MKFKQMKEERNVYGIHFNTSTVTLGTVYILKHLAAASVVGFFIAIIAKTYIALLKLPIFVV